jgi:hypothetical protein
MNYLSKTMIWQLKTLKKLKKLKNSRSQPPNLQAGWLASLAGLAGVGCLAGLGLLRLACCPDRLAGRPEGGFEAGILEFFNFFNFFNVFNCQTMVLLK